jgi:signal transduction histidine kinase
LHREVYGSLTVKQKEYLEIIHDSGQNLISLVDEIVSLGVLSDRSSQIDLTTVDLEMLCQQVINSLGDLSKQYQQTLGFSIEPGNRLWTLDKDKIRQALYYLIAGILEMSEPGGEIQIHVSQRSQVLNIAVGISHPWLGNDFGETKLHAHGVTQALSYCQNSQGDRQTVKNGIMTPHTPPILTSSALMMVINDKNTLEQNGHKIPRDILGLLFCCHLTEMQGGKVVVQGSPNSGYRYLLQIPPQKST